GWHDTRGSAARTGAVDARPPDAPHGRGGGRLAASDATVVATISALEQGEFYQRWLALQACFGSDDGAHVARALRDPSRAIRGLAARLAPLCCSDEQLQEPLASAPISQ